ncbi:MAG: carboxylesterase family protein [Bacteroidales bacterium]|nr:carboxylesterase family protein [Bacteroidales bacterium]
MKRIVTILAGVVLLSACCHQKAPSAYLETSTEASKVAVTGGEIAGFIENGIYTYKGVPYAEAQRFMAPTDPTPWEGVRSCRAYGPTAPQAERMGWRDDKQAFAYNWNDGFPGEDCLRVNVWTPGIGDAKKRPVMVWLHGGGFHSGSGQEQAAYDGNSLAKAYDVVVVTLNHRLNCLGFLDLRDFGQKYEASANAGMLDIVKALEWVKANAEAFGGDPSNVTIFGQSGGGGKVTTTMAMPSAKGLFQKAIVQSGSITTVMEEKYSRMLGSLTVKELGLNAATIEQIETVPYKELYDACERARVVMMEQMKADGTLPSNILCWLLVGTEPTVDGKYLPSQPGTPESMEVSKNIPTMIGTTMHEFTVGQADEIFKPLAVEQVKARSAYGCAPVYFYQFDWESPVLDGALGSGHCMDIPFVFDNVARYNTMTGGRDEDIELGHRISALWASFARDGKPVAKGIPAWTPYSEESPLTMHLNTKSELR